MGSPQTLSETERRIVAAWAADCAERVLGLFEAEAPRDSRPRDSIARTRAFARGEYGVSGEIGRRFVGGDAAREVSGHAAPALPRTVMNSRRLMVPHPQTNARTLALDETRHRERISRQSCRGDQ